MKLVYLSNITFPSERAHAVQIFHMCQAFASAGAAVTLYTNKLGNTTQSPAAVYGHEPQFAWQQLPPRRWFGSTVVGFLVRELVFTLAAWRRCRHEQYDVLFSRHEVVLWGLTYLLPRTTLVFESHEAKYNWAVRRLVQRQVAIVVISQGIYDAYRAYGVPEQQLLIAEDAIDESFFAAPISQAEARQRLGLSVDLPVVLYIGGLAAWKGIETFCAAAEYTSVAQFVVIGGSETEVVKLQSQYPAVQFLGARPYRDLVHNQQAADMLVIPNTATIPLSSQYTSPLKLYAHMTSGVPLILSAVPSLTSVVDQGDAYWFQPDDPAALAHTVEQVISEQSAAQARAATLRTKAQSCTWHARATRIMEFVPRAL